MIPKVTDETRQVERRHPGDSLEIDDELRRQLQIGFDQADRGELEEWDVDEFLDRMHRPE